jgi:DNA-binding response OmpR family regulator
MKKKLTHAAPRLLLIEDHSDLAEVTAALLRHQGFEVQVAGTGKEAIEAARAFVPEIVLCDMSLPDMSGFDVARELRSHSETARVLFAVHSAMKKSDLGMTEVELLAANVDLFLTKPLTAEMIETLRRGRIQ